MQISVRLAVLGLLLAFAAAQPVTKCSSCGNSNFPTPSESRCSWSPQSACLGLGPLPETPLPAWSSWLTSAPLVPAQAPAW